MSDDFPIPRGPAELTMLLVSASMISVYSAMTLAARRGRLTEHDIARIERDTLANLAIPPGVAEEFTTFEAEPAFKQAEIQMRKFFQAAKSSRARQIAEKP